MDKLSWIFELIDKVSGPANAASSSIDKVDRAMNRANGTSTSFTARLVGAGAAFSRFTFAVLPTVIALGQIATAGIAVGNVMRMMGVNTATLRAGFSAIKGGAAQAAASVRAFGAKAWAALKRIPPSAYIAAAAIVGIGVAAWGAKRAVSALLSPIRQLGSMAISALPFVAIGSALATIRGQFDMIVSRQRFVRGFDIMLGDGQGERVFQRLVGLSEVLGTDINETATAARELFSKGFDEARVFELVQGFADLRAVNPSASLDRIALAMGQVRQAGRLQGDELNQLAEGGLNLSRVMPRIAAELGIETTGVRDAMRDGRITADIFERAVLGAMQEQAHGTIGGIATEMSHSLGGEWERLQQAPDRFFERVARGGTASTDRLTTGLRRINEMLDPSTPQGQRMVESLSKGLNLIADGLDWLTTHTSDISQAWGIFKAILIPVEATLRGMWFIITTIADAMSGWSTLLGTLGGDLSMFGVKANVQIALWKASFLGFTASMYNVGRDTVMGLVRGLTDFAALPATAIMNMGDGMLTALRGALGIHSPSAEMAYLGEMAGAGFMQGLDSTGMGTSLEGRMQAPQMGSTAQASALMGNTINVTINVNAEDAQDGERMAQQIRALLMPELSGVFDALAMEAGV